MEAKGLHTVVVEELIGSEWIALRTSFYARVSYDEVVALEREWVKQVLPPYVKVRFKITNSVDSSGTTHYLSSSLRETW